MRYIQGLTQETISLLERIYQQSQYYQVRQRVHCLIFSHKGDQISQRNENFSGQS